MTMETEQETGLHLRQLHAQWQEAYSAAERAQEAFTGSALAHLRLSGRGTQAAVWEAQAALGHEARWRVASYLAWQLELAPWQDSLTEVLLTDGQ